MNLEKLKKDWDDHPCLNRVACETVDDLAAHLKHCHAHLMSDKGGPYGYLYQQQVQLVRKLKNDQRK